MQGVKKVYLLRAVKFVHSKIDPLNADDGWIYIEKEDETNGFVPATYVEATEDGKWIVGRVLYEQINTSLGIRKTGTIILVNITKLSNISKRAHQITSHQQKIQEHEKTKIYRRRKSMARYSIIKK